MNISVCIEIIHFILHGIQILVLNRVTLVVFLVYLGKIGSVCIKYRIYRQHTVSQYEVIAVRNLVIRKCCRTGQSDSQTVVDGTLRELETEAVSFHGIVAHDTVAIQVREGGAIVTLGTTAGHGYTVILRNTGTGHFVEPIGIGTIQIVSRGFQTLAVCIRTPLVGIHKIGLISHLIHSYITVVRDHSLGS